MKTVWIIAVKDMLESFRNKAVYFNIAIMLFLPFPYLEILRNNLAGLAEQGGSRADMITASHAFLANALYALPLTLTMLFVPISQHMPSSSRRLSGPLNRSCLLLPV